MYEYKDKKEEEIRKLSNDYTFIKGEIDKTKNDYENLIETTTNQIEAFLKKASSDKII